VTTHAAADVGRKSRQEAVIFDHDGTLVDSENITLTVVAEIAVEAGAEIRPEDPAEFTGADLHIVFKEIEKRTGKPLPSDIFQQFRSRQTELIREGLQEVAGATDLLSSLTLPMAVASNAPIAKMELCLGATDLLRFFDPGHLFSAYDVEAWKPEPDVFLAAAAQLGVEPGRCVVVEDSLPGVHGAIAAGMQVIALDPSGRFADIENVTAVSSLRDVAQLIT